MLKFNNKVLKILDKWLNPISSPVPPGPPNTVRVRTNDGNVPEKAGNIPYNTSYETATLVPGTLDVYDVYKSGTSFRRLLYGSSNVIEVLGANTSNVTDMAYMFAYCTALQSIPLFNTSDVTDMGWMFYNCTSLNSVPLFDTSNVTDMVAMFSYCTALQSIPLFDTSNVTGMEAMFSSCTALQSIPLFNTSKVTSMLSTFNTCINVQSGALALYQQASSQANPPTIHTATFRLCGSNTTTGAAELAQIPGSWGGEGG